VTRVYLQNSTQAIFVSETGHQHLRSASAEDERPTVINCPECEPYLVRDFAGVYSPEQVPLTQAQVAARERETREGNTAVSEAAKALAISARASLAAGPAAADDLDARIAAAVATALAAQKPARRTRKAKAD
jgi:hypothetical protein